MDNIVITRVVRIVVFLAAVGIAVGCATTTPSPETPQMAGPKWPPAGSTQVIAEKRTGSFGQSSGEVTITFLGPKEWQGRSLMAVTNGKETFYSEENGNWTATARAGAAVASADPPVQMYDWPIFVGKRWRTRFQFRDHELGRTFNNVTHDASVKALEEVKTGAGPIKALRITKGDRWFEESYWISPELGTWVKYRAERTADNYLGAGSLEWDLVSYNFKQ